MGDFLSAGGMGGWETMNGAASMVGAVLSWVGCGGEGGVLRVDVGGLLGLFSFYEK